MGTWAKFLEFPDLFDRKVPSGFPNFGTMLLQRLQRANFAPTKKRALSWVFLGGDQLGTDSTELIDNLQERARRDC